MEDAPPSTTNIILSTYTEEISVDNSDESQRLISATEERSLPYARLRPDAYRPYSLADLDLSEGNGAEGEDSALINVHSQSKNDTETDGEATGAEAPSLVRSVSGYVAILPKASDSKNNLLSD